MTVGVQVAQCPTVTKRLETNVGIAKITANKQERSLRKSLRSVRKRFERTETHKNSLFIHQSIRSKKKYKKCSKVHGFKPRVMGLSAARSCLARQGAKTPRCERPSLWPVGTFVVQRLRWGVAATVRYRRVCQRRRASLRPQSRTTRIGRLGWEGRSWARWGYKQAASDSRTAFACPCTLR